MNLRTGLFQVDKHRKSISVFEKIIKNVYFCFREALSVVKEHRLGNHSRILYVSRDILSEVMFLCCNVILFDSGPELRLL